MVEKKEEEEMVVGGKGCCRSCDRLREKRRKRKEKLDLLRGKCKCMLLSAANALSYLFL